MAGSLQSRCLCGDVAWQSGPPFELATHCHCSRCRKAHGAAFATYVMCPAATFRWLAGRERVTRFESSPGAFRYFCSRCGSTVPSEQVWNDRIGLPAGMLEGDPETRPIAHIFAAAKAPWYEISDSLPRFDAYPPGIDVPVVGDLEERDPPAAGAARGSCLCGAARYLVDGPVVRCHNCHCLRCRRAKAALHATNFFTRYDGVRYTRGEDLLTSFKLPEARFFTQRFCRICGSPMPHLDRERGIAIVPMGSLDDDPGERPTRHVFVGSKLPWFEIMDTLPQFAERPPEY
jgi:hypothetical protein